MNTSSLFVRNSAFPASPDPRRYVPVENVDESRQRLMRGIDRDEGISVLIGPTGSGKTLICQTLAAAYKTSLDVVLLSDARLCTRRALLQSILFHLDLPYRDIAEGELRLSLLDHLRPRDPSKAARRLLLIVDEAQTLPGRLIDELRMIAGVSRDGQACVRLVLAGNMRFEERLNEPAMESLAQRIGVRCYLHPLSLEETRQYIQAHLQLAGLKPEVIRDDAIRSVFQATDGIPRLINQLMDHSLCFAEAQGRDQLDMAVIEASWALLNQLPTPYTDKDFSTSSSETHVVEFGSLEEEVVAESPEHDPSHADVAETPGAFEAPAALAPADPAIVSANAAAIHLSVNACSMLAESPGLPAMAVDAVSVLTLEDHGPWTFMEAPILHEHTVSGKRLSSAPASASPQLSSSVVNQLSSGADAQNDAPIATSGSLDSVITPAAAAHEVFGEDFEETIEVQQPVRVSVQGPLPWAGELAADAQWLEAVDIDECCETEQQLHREIIKICDETRSSHDPIHHDVRADVEVAEDIFEVDDSDMLIVAEDVVEISGRRTTQDSMLPREELQYRNLFSRLRQG